MKTQGNKTDTSRRAERSKKEQRGINARPRFHTGADDKRKSQTPVSWLQAWRSTKQKKDEKKRQKRIEREEHEGKTIGNATNSDTRQSMGRKHGEGTHQCCERRKRLTTDRKIQGSQRESIALED